MFHFNLPESQHKFNAYIDDISEHDLIQLPSGEYVSAAEIYLMCSPSQYFKDYAQWLVDNA